MVIPITCDSCKHHWHTKSKLKRVTCPKCNNKVRNVDPLTIKQAIKNIIGI